ncbi:hypothetical protein EDB87DRAFT_1835810 [Lactarius vividus]|nr:hypothetical protein EDB87DRAFT_1835810 [Lactarius vividus]
MSSSLASAPPPNPLGPSASKNNIQDGVTSDGCFCQARTHALSEYTLLCGLVLCTLHPPHRPCPHCAAPLLDLAAHAALLVQLEEQQRTYAR